VIANQFGFSKQFLWPAIEAHPHLFREAYRTGEDVVFVFAK
jgi:hypothetical protein